MNASLLVGTPTVLTIRPIYIHIKNCCWSYFRWFYYVSGKIEFYSQVLFDILLRSKNKRKEKKVLDKIMKCREQKNLVIGLRVVFFLSYVFFLDIPRSWFYSFWQAAPLRHGAFWQEHDMLLYSYYSAHVSLYDMKTKPRFVITSFSSVSSVVIGAIRLKRIKRERLWPGNVIIDDVIAPHCGGSLQERKTFGLA